MSYQEERQNGGGRYESGTNFYQSKDSQGNSNSGNSAGGWNNNRGNNGGGWNKGGGGFNKGGFNKGGFNRGNWKKQEEDEGDPALYKPYVISGNPNPPAEVVESITKIAKELEAKGYTVRLGGFDGIEDTVEKATTKHEVHLPWRGFNEKESKFTFTPQRAKDIAKLFHPSFDGLKPVIQTFLAKNVRMVMGKDLKGPSLFAIIWSEDGAEKDSEKSFKTGNVGHLLSIANDLRIQVFNFGKPDAEARLRAFLDLNYNGQKEPQQPITTFEF